MTAPTILAIIKYLSLLVTAASSVWALIAKTSYEDENKRKRLTSAGFVSIAIIVTSAVMGMLAYGFETLVKQQQEQTAATKAQRKEAAEAADKAERDRATAAREASRRADAAEQRYLVLAAQAEQRRSDEHISQQVVLGSARNLTKAEAALSQLERLLHPLDSPVISVIWDVDLTSLKDDPYFKMLQDRIGRLSPRGNETDEDLEQFWSPDRSRSWLRFGEKSTFYPTNVLGMTPLLLASLQTRVDLFALSAKADAASRLARSEQPFSSDYRVLLHGMRSHDAVVVTYYRNHMEITVTDRAISVGDIDRSGVIASVQDFRNAQVFVSLTPSADAWKDTPWSSYAKIGPNIHLQKVNIRIGGREFQIDGKSMQADRLKGALPVYAGHFSES